MLQGIEEYLRKSSENEERNTDDDQLQIIEKSNI